MPDGQDLTTRLARVDLHGNWDRTGSDFGAWSTPWTAAAARCSTARSSSWTYEQGDYDQDGTFVGYDLGDFDVVTVGTDSLVATTEVSADFSCRRQLSRLGKDRYRAPGSRSRARPCAGAAAPTTWAA